MKKKKRTDVKRLKSSEGVYGGSGNSGVIENILSGYCVGRIGIIQLCCRRFNVYFVRLYNIQSEIADSRLAVVSIANKHEYKHNCSGDNIFFLF